MSDDKKIDYITSAEDIRNMNDVQVSNHIKELTANQKFDEAEKAYRVWEADPNKKFESSQSMMEYMSGEGNDAVGIGSDSLSKAIQESRAAKKKYDAEKSQNYKADKKVTKTPKGNPNEPPNTFTTKKAVESSGGLSEELNKISSEVSKNYRGIAGDPLIGDESPPYIPLSGDKELSGKHNTSIVFGRDRPASMFSGYQKEGDTQVGAIDIVVGRLGYKARSRDKKGKPLYTDPNFVHDAARIYISQKSDIDEYFNLADGIVGNSKTKSAIGMKADGIRIIARDGIKLITRTDRVNSQGGDVVDVNGIDLIATNDDSDLQPLVKGGNLAEALMKLTDQVDSLNGIVDSLLQYQSYFNEALTNHFHYAPAEVYTFPGGVVWKSTPSPPVVAAGMKTMMDHLSQTKRSLMTHTANLAAFKLNYFSPMGSKYINSRYNNTT
ncbi:MAG: hypothetical protein ACXAC2_06095 [Candidatus Kariarchaeaceae archaeon]|jgi:hypothetical protein